MHSATDLSIVFGFQGKVGVHCLQLSSALLQSELTFVQNCQTTPGEGLLHSQTAGSTTSCNVETILNTGG